MLTFVLACTTKFTPPATPDASGEDTADPTTPGTTDTDDGTDDPTDSAAACPDGPGSACDPFPITTFPYRDQQDTSESPHEEVDSYGCDRSIDESGPEWWYVVELTETGLLTASIDEQSGDGVDVDVHLLSGPNPGADCVARDHEGVAELLEPGTYFLVLDTWSEGGVAAVGPYRLVVDFEPGDVDACEVTPTDVEMVWSSCSSSVPDCYEQGGDVFLSTPTTGPVVKEAHLVTTIDGFGGGWPQSFTDGINAHYANSEGVSGYSMARTEPWAPSGEGGSEYGQSAYSAKLPPEDEAWYLNMYWRSRPTPGTRMIVRNRSNGRAVVAAGGYETGPGDNTAIGGVAEEVHDWLGTGHLDDLEIGFAADQSLPLGPITCR
jgi:hypothetical protein